MDTTRTADRPGSLAARIAARGDTRCLSVFQGKRCPRQRGHAGTCIILPAKDMTGSAY